jgi:isocitrate/isopropylmalate dehydrogenase
MMLAWLGERDADSRLSDAAQLLEDCIRASFAAGQVRTFEFGGSDGTKEVTQAVLNNLAPSARHLTRVATN